MMICKADFEELFPDLFKPEPAVAAHQTAADPSADFIARREETAGRKLPTQPHLASAPGYRSAHDHANAGFAQTGSVATDADKLAA